MEEHVKRMYDERKELNEKVEKLNVFVHALNPAFMALDPMKQRLMAAQLGAMSSYLIILDTRIELEQ